MSAKAIPYERATSGERAREETRRLLMRFGCSRVGFMDEFDTHSLVLAFEHRKRKVQMRASASGWAKLWLDAHPYGYRMRCTPHEHEKRALAQGMVAVNSMLRDWVKGQIAAVECGLVEFEHVFLPYTLTSSGQTVAELAAATPERLNLLLAEPEGKRE